MGSNVADIQGPGLLFVNSKITRPGLIDEDAFFKWYDDDHIVEILQTSGIQSAFRFKDVTGSDADRPFLAMYPMKDIAFTQTKEFRNISVHSEMLPHGGPVYDIADFDTRYYNLVQVIDPTKKGRGSVKSVVVAQYSLDVADDEFKSWLERRLFEGLAGTSGHLRTTMYKLVYARSNAQSRALKGLSTTNETSERPPLWLVVHEFESADVNPEWLERLTSYVYGPLAYDLGIKVRPSAQKHGVFRLVKTRGQGDFFHGVDM
ncbi:putative alpha/beta hydrolase [Colletotrichum karsti]|uniref:Alpha/beta hydrolase n=1 Tax=Colletotrichum karsti TaxID=1095194 RepID=A0A9P6I7D7_9PEZI|nr:putative alpha/beta hydrolase [Colletotrichum karsti]KAF9877117.1 putative alpha/beta hydrolase [Colletotrichum karsti]